MSLPTLRFLPVYIGNRMKSHFYGSRIGVRDDNIDLGGGFAEGCPGFVPVGNN